MTNLIARTVPFIVTVLSVEFGKISSEAMMEAPEIS